MLPNYALTDLIKAALAEDVGAGDITTSAVLAGGETGTAAATAKEGFVLSGVAVFGAVFLTFDPTLVFTPRGRDGDWIPKGAVIAEISGSLASILTAERVALNLLQRMCGIATMTRRFVDEAAGTKARIIDTRKTAPGLRALDKSAVLAGGGANHRFALYDGVLIKDNHIAAAGGITAAVARARGRIPHTLKIEVEVKNAGELTEALQAGADLILLDNMDIAGLAEAVKITAGRVPLEASGNMTPERIRAVAQTGVDFISVGALTHSVQASDISLNITETTGGAVSGYDDKEVLQGNAAAGNAAENDREKQDDAGCAAPVPVLDISLLKARLRGFTIGSPLHYFESVDSTNALALKFASEDAPEGTVVLADRQTAGRGRLGRAWQSPAGRNLYFSIILRPEGAASWLQMEMAKAAQVTFLAGVAAAETLRAFCPDGVAIKWPNDVLIHGKKACGILSEMRAGKGEVALVVGVGINVNIRKDDFSVEHRETATSLFEETGRELAREDVLCDFCAHFQYWRGVFLKDGFEPIRRAWLHRTDMVGKNVRVLFGNEIKEGAVSGIDDDGALLLAASGGGVERIIAGDATVMKG